MEASMTAKNVTIAPEILERAGKAASEAGLAVDELASEALQLELGRRSLDGFRRQGYARRRDMSDGEVERTVEVAVHDVRTRGSYKSTSDPDL
jgi:hypothetical protein